jgi:hypothetical protein
MIANFLSLAFLSPALATGDIDGMVARSRNMAEINALFAIEPSSRSAPFDDWPTGARTRSDAKRAAPEGRCFLLSQKQRLCDGLADLRRQVSHSLSGPSSG